MPNWCDCDLTITGPKTELLSFIQKARDSPENLYNEKPEPKNGAELIAQTIELVENKKQEKVSLCSDVFVPVPKEIRHRETDEKPNTKLIEKYGVDNAYDFHVKYWGSKWGICEPTEPVLGARTLRYSFQSPWSPPEALIKAMSKQHPHLHFRLKYYEAGNAFSGSFDYDKGRKTDST